MDRLIVLGILLAGLALCHGQGGTISFRLNTYSNPGGYGDNGNCCDGIFPVCKKSSQCDHYFNICFDDPESDNDDMSVCPFGRYTTGIIELNEITFGAMIDSTPNPKELRFNNAWPYNVKIKVQVWDEDGTNWLGNDNADDFVDYIYTIQSIHPDGYANEITISGRTTLVATMIVNCNNDGMSNDCITPLPPFSTEPRHHLPIQCYECSTSDMTTMDPGYISAWEGLTKRDMSYIEVSPQCQDVAADPEQFLQNCEGVCLTGLWDVDQDFIFRTCVAVTKDCDDLDDSGDPAATYHCSSQSKGNNGRYLVEGVQLPETDPGFEPEPTVDTAPQRPPIQCYECATKDMTLMDQSYISQWEGLTLRSMADVAVTPQCQDVAATPDEYLQSCDGVCLTGLWDEEQDFIFRTCIGVTYDCSDMEADPESSAWYYCSDKTKGNDDKHLIEGENLMAAMQPAAMDPAPMQSAPMQSAPMKLAMELAMEPAASDSKFDSAGWQCYDGWAIEGHNMKIEQDVTLDECKQLCLDMEGCVNVEYGEIKRTRGDKYWCILGDITIEDAKTRSKASLWNPNQKYLTTCEKA